MILSLWVMGNCNPKPRLSFVTLEFRVYPDAVRTARAWSAGGSHRVRRGLLGVKDSPDDIQPKTPQREGWYMQKYSSRRHQWSDVYFFTEQEWQTADYDVPNLWCSHNHTLFSKVQPTLSRARKFGRCDVSKLRVHLQPCVRSYMQCALVAQDKSIIESCGANARHQS